MAAPCGRSRDRARKAPTGDRSTEREAPVPVADPEAVTSSSYRVRPDGFRSPTSVPAPRSGGRRDRLWRGASATAGAARRRRRPAGPPCRPCRWRCHRRSARSSRPGWRTGCPGRIRDLWPAAADRRHLDDLRAAGHVHGDRRANTLRLERQRHGGPTEEAAHAEVRARRCSIGRRPGRPSAPPDPPAASARRCKALPSSPPLSPDRLTRCGAKAKKTSDFK